MPSCQAFIFLIFSTKFKLLKKQVGLNPLHWQRGLVEGESLLLF